LNARILCILFILHNVGSQALHDCSHACTWSYVLTLAALSPSSVMPASSVVEPGILDVKGCKEIVL